LEAGAWKAVKVVMLQVVESVLQNCCQPLMVKGVA
jgi:hypothetical protein